MFSDPLVAAMTMLMLFFIGMVIMFLSLARTIASLQEEFRESMRKQQMYLSDVEQQLMQISFTLRTLQEGVDVVKTLPGKKPLGENPILRQDDPLLSMLEATARKNVAASSFEDQLLPPPSKGRSAVEDYDPANDPNFFDDAFLAHPGKKADRLKRGG